MNTLASSTRSKNPQLTAIVDFNRGKPVTKTTLEEHSKTPKVEELGTSNTSKFFDADETLVDKILEISVDQVQMQAQAQEIQITLPSTSSPPAIPITPKMTTLSVEEVAALLAAQNKQIPKFNRDKIDTWIFSFEHAVKKDSDEVKIDKLINSLTDDVLEWFRSEQESPNAPTNFEDWKTKLLAHYVDKPHVALGKLTKRKQLESEKPEKYCLEILSLCKRVNPAMSMEEKLHHLRNGLLDKYKAGMRFMKPTNEKEFQESLETLITDNLAEQSKPSELAILSEAFLTLAQNQNSQPKPESTLVASENPTRSNQRKNSKKCQYCSKDGHEANDCFQIPGHPRYNNHQSRNSQQTPQPLLQFPVQNQGSGVPCCQFCKRTGHQADRCFHIVGFPPKRNGFRNQNFGGGRNSWNNSRTRYTRNGDPVDNYEYHAFDGVPPTTFQGAEYSNSLNHRSIPNPNANGRQ